MNQQGQPPDIAELRDRVARKLDEGTTGGFLATAREIHDLSTSLRALDEIVAANRHVKPAPPFNVEQLAGEVWNAVAEAGGSTRASDAAVDAIRKAVA